MNRTLLALTLFAFTGCMKQAIGGLGLGWDQSHPATPACSQSVIDAYQSSRLTNTDPTLRQQYEVTFNCSLDGVN